MQIHRSHRFGRWHRFIAAAFSLALVIPASAWAANGTEEQGTPGAAEVLERALGNLNVSRSERMRLTNYDKDRRGFQRDLEISMKRDDDRFRVLGTFTAEQEIRGTSFLVVPQKDSDSSENQVSPNQYFIYLPALRNTRRVSGAQRADSFFGTHLSQGDVEPHPASHYRPVGLRSAEVDGEPILLVTVEPRFEAGYDRLVLHVAAKDYAVLKLEQYVRGRELPTRTIETRRDWLEEVEGHVLPKKLIAWGKNGRSRTEVEFFERQVGKPIADELFSASTLTRRGR